MDPQTQPVQPIANTTAPRKNFLLLGILMIVAAILGSGATYLAVQSKTHNQSQPQPSPIVQRTPTPTPNPTANWKTYKNISGTYTVMFPNGWYQKEFDTFFTNNIPGLFISAASKYEIESKGASSISIKVYDNPNKLNIEEFVYESRVNKEFITPTYKDKVINGYQAKITSLPGECAVNTVAYIAKDRLMYAIELNNCPGKGKVITPETFNQILSTFKFTDQTSEGKFCGGIAANLPENQCPTGYTCKLDGSYPDAGGKCSPL